jgi:sulfatase maturation enzyme AslB (radical SAM superfamily)
MARQSFPSQGIAEFLRPADAGGLPIFRQDYVQYSAFYAPGALCVVPRSESEHFEADLTTPRPATECAIGKNGDWGWELCRRAKQAVAGTNRQREEAFRPECLTLYLNNECNLRCTYCYSVPSHEPTERLQQETVAAAAEVVAENCSLKDMPFYVVFQGGGEPALHSSQIGSTLSLV